MFHRFGVQTSIYIHLLPNHRRGRTSLRASVCVHTRACAFRSRVHSVRGRMRECVRVRVRRVRCVRTRVRRIRVRMCAAMRVCDAFMHECVAFVRVCVACVRALRLCVLLAFARVCCVRVRVRCVCARVCVVFVLAFVRACVRAMCVSFMCVRVQMRYGVDVHPSIPIHLLPDHRRERTSLRASISRGWPVSIHSHLFTT